MPTTTKTATVKPETTEELTNEANVLLHMFIAGQSVAQTFLTSGANVRIPINPGTHSFNPPLELSGGISFENNSKYQSDVAIQYEAA